MSEADIEREIAMGYSASQLADEVESWAGTLGYDMVKFARLVAHTLVERYLDEYEGADEDE